MSWAEPERCRAESDKYWADLDDWLDRVAPAGWPPGQPAEPAPPAESGQPAPPAALAGLTGLAGPMALAGLVVLVVRAGQPRR